MPVMDGLEATSKISELGIKTPIVVMTANIMSNDLALYKSIGIHDCIGKPFTSQELWGSLAKYFKVEGVSKINKHQLSVEKESTQKQLRLYFVRTNQTIYAEIEKAANAGEFELAHRLAHTLKGNAGQIGEGRLQEAAAAAETMFSGGVNLFDKEKMTILEAELKSALDELAPLLIEADNANLIKTDDREKILEIIEKLEPMLIESRTECMNLLDDIRTIPGAESLARYVEEFEFEQAIAELADFRKRLV
jgi:CheY-like chemotaxis protein